MKCYFYPYKITCTGFPNENGPVFIDNTKTKLSVCSFNNNEHKIIPCTDGLELYNDLYLNKTIVWYECQETLGRSYFVLPGPCDVLVSKFENIFEVFENHKDIQSKYGVEKYFYKDGKCTFSIDGHIFEVTGEEGDCSTECEQPIEVMTFESLPQSIPEATKEEEQNITTSNQTNNNPVVWENDPDPSVTIGAACFPEMQISNNNYNQNNPNIAYLNSGHAVVVYEDKDGNNNTSIKLSILKTSINNKIVYYRNLSFGTLVNNVSVSVSHIGNFTIYDDVYISIDNNNAPIDSISLGFLTGPLAGKIFTINKATREIQSSGIAKWTFSFDLQSNTITFPNNDNLYNIKYFIISNTDQSLPGQYSSDSLVIEPHLYNNVQVPVSNPTITTLSNDISPDGSQNIYLSYQAFEDEKWNVYLRHIMLSDHSFEPPEYVKPYTFGPPSKHKTPINTDEAVVYKTIGTSTSGGQLCAVFQVGLLSDFNPSYTETKRISQDVKVNGTCCVQFAGQKSSNNSMILFDNVNEHLPVEVSLSGIKGSVTINTTGGTVSHCNTCSYYGADGEAVAPSLENYSSYGISPIKTNLSSLVGVFLTDDDPSPPAMSINSVPYGPSNINTTPKLQQSFFIGSGTKMFTPPNGATRLFLGVHDYSNWSDNSGYFQVTVDFYSETYHGATFIPLETCEDSEGESTICDITVQNKYALVSAIRSSSPGCDTFGPQWEEGNYYTGIIPPKTTDFVNGTEDPMCIESINVYPSISQWCVNKFECQQFKISNDSFCPSEYLSIIYKPYDLWVLNYKNGEEYKNITRVVYHLGAFSYNPEGITEGYDNKDLSEFWTSESYENIYSHNSNSSNSYILNTETLSSSLKASNFNAKPYAVWKDNNLYQFAQITSGQTTIWRSVLNDNGILTDIYGNASPTPMSIISSINHDGYTLSGAAIDRDGFIWISLSGNNIGDKLILSKINAETGIIYSQITTDIVTSGGSSLENNDMPLGFAIIQGTSSDRFIVINSEWNCINTDSTCLVYDCNPTSAYEINISDGSSNLLYTFSSDWVLRLKTFTVSTYKFSYDSSGWAGDIEKNRIYWKGSITKDSIYKNAIYVLDLDSLELSQIYSVPDSSVYTNNICIRTYQTTETFNSENSYNIKSFRIVERDTIGYEPTFIRESKIIISYEGDLSDFWTYHKDKFSFIDEVPDSSATNKGLSNFPFDLSKDKLYIDQVHIDGDVDKWVYFNTSLPLLYQYPNYGHLGNIKSEPIFINQGRRPKVVSNNQNNVFVIYENESSGTTQVYISGTGDFFQSSIVGPKGCRTTKLIESQDFIWYKKLTSDGINQLCDICVDKNDVIHLAWQSNRDKYWEIYYANSSNDFEAVRVTDSTSTSAFPSISIADNGNVFIVYQDNRFKTYQILMSVKKDTRTIPLLQQDAYLASYRSDYNHYVNILPIIVTNSTGNDDNFNIILSFFNNKSMSGAPSIVVDSRSSTDSFINLEEDPYFGAIGVFLKNGETKTVHFSSISESGNNKFRPFNFNKNATYFPKVTIINSSNVSIVDQNNSNISFSCSKCNTYDHQSVNSQGCFYSFVIKNNESDNYYNFFVDFYSDEDQRFLLRRYNLSYNSSDLQYTKVNEIDATNEWSLDGLFIKSSDSKYIQIFANEDPSLSNTCGIKQYIKVVKCNTPSCEEFTELQSNRWTASSVPPVYEGTASYKFITSQQIGDNLSTVWQSILNDKLVYSEFNKPNWSSEEIYSNIVWADLVNINDKPYISVIQIENNTLVLKVITKQYGNWQEESIGVINGYINDFIKCEILNWLGNPCIFIKQPKSILFYYKESGVWRHTSWTTYESNYFKSKILNNYPTFVYLNEENSNLYYRVSTINDSINLTNYDAMLDSYNVSEADVDLIDNNISISYIHEEKTISIATLLNGFFETSDILSKSSSYRIYNLSLLVINNRPSIAYSAGVYGTEQRDIYYVRYNGEKWNEEIIDIDLTSTVYGDIYPKICNFNQEAAISVIYNPVKVYYSDVDFESTSYIQPIYFCECSSQLFAPSNVVPIDSIPKWISSNNGDKDIRVTDTTFDSYNPKCSVASNNLIITWNQNENETYKLKGALFDIKSENIFSSGSGKLFDFDFQISGRNQSSTTDIYNRICMSYEKWTSKNEVDYKVCDLKQGQTINNEFECDISSFTSNVISSDPLISNKIVKKVKVINDDVKYYTYNVANKLTPIVSKCSISLQVFGTPEIVALRYKNENETSFSDWCPWNPMFGRYYTIQPWKLSPNAGIKEVCIQAMTYNGITTQYCLPIIADYAPITYEIKLYSDSNYSKSLPTYNNIPVASVDIAENYLKRTIYVEIITSTNIGTSSINYDVIQQGYNDIYNNIAFQYSINSYRGSFVIFKNNNSSNVDGVAQIVPKFSYCSNQKTISTYSFTKDQFNQSSITETKDSSNLDIYRQSISGRVGIPVTIRDTSEDPYFIFGDPNYSVLIKDEVQEIGPADILQQGIDSLPGDGSNTVPSDTIIPPNNLSASTGEFVDKILVSWDLVTDISSYIVYRGTIPNPNVGSVISEVSNNTYEDSNNLEFGITYYYWVKSKKDSTVSKFSLSTSGYIKDGRPSTPSSLKASDGSFSDHVYITWNSSNNSNEYEIWRNTNNNLSTASQIGTSSANNYSDSSTSLSTLYYYWVRAKNNLGNSNFSTYDVGYSGAAPSPPVPASISATKGIYATKISVNWPAVSSATSYKLYRGLSQNSLTSIAEVTSPSYDDLEAEYGKTWWYAVSSIGNGFESDKQCCDSGYKANSQVTNVNATINLTDRIRVSWDIVPESISYDVYRKYSSNSFVKIATVNALFYEDFSVSPYTDYSYYIRANINGIITLPSDNSIGYIISIPPSPVSILATNNICNIIEVSTVLPSLSKYYDIIETRVYRNTSDDFSSSTRVVALTNGGDDDSILFGINYYYWATSVGSAGESPPCNSVVGNSPNAIDLPFPVVAENGCGNIDVLWGSVADADYYTLQYGPTGEENSINLYSGPPYSLTCNGKTGVKLNAHSNSLGCSSKFSEVSYAYGEQLINAAPSSFRAICSLDIMRRAVKLYWTWDGTDPDTWEISLFMGTSYVLISSVSGNLRSTSLNIIYNHGIPYNNWKINAVNTCGAGNAAYATSNCR